MTKQHCSFDSVGFGKWALMKPSIGEHVFRKTADISVMALTDEFVFVLQPFWLCFLLELYRSAMQTSLKTFWNAVGKPQCNCHLAAGI